MPRDTPPPIPRQRPRLTGSRPGGGGGNANTEPLGAGREHLQDRASETPDLSLPPKPVAAVQKVYESAPQVRDLRKEATQRFMPTVVKRKIDASKGQGKLLEEHELDRLEREGYGGTSSADQESVATRGMSVDAAPAVDDVSAGVRRYSSLEEEQGRRLAEEEEKFAREMTMAGEEGEEEVKDGPSANLGKRVIMEEVEDEEW